MFYEVKVKNKKTKQQRIISPNELSRRHWMFFQKEQKGFISGFQDNKKNFSEQ